MAVDQRFCCFLSNQKNVELCPGGFDKAVTHENHQEFCDLVVKTRLNEAEKQYEWIREGFEFIVPIDVMNFLNWEDVERRVCGPREITTEAMKSIDSSDHNHKIVKWFFEMFESFTQKERKLYLKYVWGRTKIPNDISGCQRHRIDIYGSGNGFPIAHTCFFSIDVPEYDSLEIMTEKFKYAMEMCGDIDGDFNPAGGGGYGGYDSEEE